MVTYWYSTNGVDRKRLSNRHLALLDQAYEHRARVQIHDDEVFGHNIAAVANPYMGTMTAGEIHYGLYRYPSLMQTSEASLDTQLLLDGEMGIVESSMTKVSKDLIESPTLYNQPSDNQARYNSPAPYRSQFDHNFPRSNNHEINQSNLDMNRNRIISDYRTTHRRHRSLIPEDQCVCCIIS